MNLVVTARTGISARENQQPCRDLHIAQLSGVFWDRPFAPAFDILKQNLEQMKQQKLPPQSTSLVVF